MTRECARADSRIVVISSSIRTARRRHVVRMVMVVVDHARSGSYVVSIVYILHTDTF